MSLANSIGSFAQGFAGSATAKKDRAERAAVMAQNDRLIDMMGQQMQSGGAQGGFGAMPPSGGLGYGGAAPTNNGAPPATGSAGIAATAFGQSLSKTESGGRLNALNNVKGGHGGRKQFGTARLVDAARAGIIPRMTPQEFAKQPEEVQSRVENWHFSDIDKQIAGRGLSRYEGTVINGVPITREAIYAMAHLGGMGGASKFLSSGGRHNPSDAFGTSLMDYARTHGGQTRMGARPPVS